MRGFTVYSCHGYLVTAYIFLHDYMYPGQASNMGLNTVHELNEEYVAFLSRTRTINYTPQQYRMPLIQPFAPATTFPPIYSCLSDNALVIVMSLIIALLTVYPKKYAHGFVVLRFVVVMQSFIMNSHEVFIHIHQGCFAGTGAIVRLPQCQWSKPDGYGKISQCITTTKHSKAKTVCIFLGIYCIILISFDESKRLIVKLYLTGGLLIIFERICALLGHIGIWYTHILEIGNINASPLEMEMLSISTLRTTLLRGVDQKHRTTLPLTWYKLFHSKVSSHYWWY